MAVKIFKSPSFRFALSAIMLFFGVWFFSSERNFLQSVPFIVIFGTISVFIYDNLLHNFLIVLFSSAFVFYTETFSVKETIAASVIIILFFALSVLIKLFYKKNKKIFSYITAVISLFIFCIFNGNPFSSLISTENVRIYLNECQYGNEMKITGTKYDFSLGKYLTEAYFKDGRNTVKAYFSYDKDEIIDGYQDYIGYNMLEDQRFDMINLLFEKLEERTYSTRSKNIEYDGVFSLNDNYKDYAKYMNFEIAINDAYTEEIFASYCKEFSDVLKEEAFEYNSVTFYGEKQGDFAYEMQIFADTEYEDFEKEVKDFDKDSFVFYANESSVHPFWAYEN